MKSIAEHAPPMSSPHLMLSTRLVYELGDPRGELGSCNDAPWRHLVSEAAGVVTSPGPLIVDVTGLDFMGCCAFTVLAEEAENLRRRGVELRLVSRQPVVARIVDACGLSGVLPLYPTADSAPARAGTTVRR